LSIDCHNRCEKDALTTISLSEKAIVPLKNNRQIISWGVITNPENSILNGHLIKLWKITEYEKLYYTEEEFLPLR